MAEKRSAIKKRQLFSVMQLAGGTFPSGGFSQSWGLETYVAEGKVTNCETFCEFLLVYLENTIAQCEGPILCEAYRLAQDWEVEKIMELEELSRAVKATRESRESSLRMGKAMLRIAADILGDEKIHGLREMGKIDGMTFPVVHGLVCGRMELELDTSVAAFVFSAVNALVQSAVKLVPLGNMQAQGLLLKIQPEMERAATESQRRSLTQISNFCPGMDIASILHETLPVRLYMS